MSDAWNAAAGGPGQDPGMFARLMQYINGGAPAAAMAATNRAPNPLNHPTPVPTALQGGGVSTAGLGTPPYSGLPPGVSTMSPNSQNGLPTTFGGGSFGQGGPPPQSMPYAGGQGPVGRAGESGANPLLTPPVPNTAIGWGTPQTGGDVNWAGDPRLPDFNKLPRPAGPGGGRPARQPAARIPASATASVPSATKSPWITGTAQNQDVVGGALARGGGGRPMGMLDLSRLFSRQ